MQVSAGDGLPGPVCCQCAKLVSTGYSFKLQEEKTDMLLRCYVSSHCEEDGWIKCQVETDVWPLLGVKQCLVASSMVSLLGLEVNTKKTESMLTEQNATQN